MIYKAVMEDGDDERPSGWEALGMLAKLLIILLVGWAVGYLIIAAGS